MQSDIPLTSPEPSARPLPDPVTHRPVKSCSDGENPTQKRRRSKPKSKHQAHSALMWPYDRVAGCRISRGKRYLEVVWPNTIVPVEEVEGGEEWWRKHRKMAALKQGEQQRRGLDESRLSYQKAGPCRRRESGRSSFS